MKNLTIKKQNIKDKIFTIRGVQVLLDRDLAELYGVETKVLNQAVKRNLKRFPSDFMFQLNKREIEILRSQFVTSSWGGARYRNYVFTEQGVAMLSSVLKSDRAIEINIQIMRAFVSMRRFLSKNAGIFQRLDNVERNQLEYDKNFDKVFKALEDKSIKPKQGIFFDGQIFDAYKFVNDLIKTTKKQIVLIDNYIDENTLLLFSKLKKIQVTIFTKTILKKIGIRFRKIQCSI